MRHWRSHTAGWSALLARRGARFRVVWLHALASAVLAGLLGALVFQGWYPGPFSVLSGGTALFWLIVAVDAVCGPVLLTVVYKPTKTRRELWLDVGLVVTVQLGALGYGLNALSAGRPVALVHEVDRFRLVTWAEVETSERPAVPVSLSRWAIAPVQTLGTRRAQSGQEQLESIEMALNGVDVAQRPGWWQEYAGSHRQVLARAQPVSALIRRYPDKVASIDAGVAAIARDAEPGETRLASAMVWLPLTSRHATDWVVWVDPVTARVRGFWHGL